MAAGDSCAGSKECLVIAGRGLWPASPESIITVCGYGFRARLPALAGCGGRPGMTSSRRRDGDAVRLHHASAPYRDSVPRLHRPRPGRLQQMRLALGGGRPRLPCRCAANALSGRGKTARAGRLKKVEKTPRTLLTARRCLGIVSARSRVALGRTAQGLRGLSVRDLYRAQQPSEFSLRVPCK